MDEKIKNWIIVLISIMATIAILSSMYSLGYERGAMDYKEGAYVTH